MNQSTKGPAMYKNFFDCFTKIVKAEGALSLWTGFIPSK